MGKVILCKMDGTNFPVAVAAWRGILQSALKCGWLPGQELHRIQQGGDLVELIDSTALGELILNRPDSQTLSSFQAIEAELPDGQLDLLGLFLKFGRVYVT